MGSRHRDESDTQTEGVLVTCHTYKVVYNNSTHLARFGERKGDCSPYPASATRNQRNARRTHCYCDGGCVCVCAEYCSEKCKAPPIN